MFRPLFIDRIEKIYTLIGSAALFTKISRRALIHENLGELSPMVFRDFQDNPVVLALLGAIGVFLAAQYFSSRLLLKLRGSPFLQKRLRANAGALTQKRGFAGAKNYFISHFSASCRLRFSANKETTRRRHKAERRDFLSLRHF